MQRESERERTRVLKLSQENERILFRFAFISCREILAPCGTVHDDSGSLLKLVVVVVVVVVKITQITASTLDGLIPLYQFLSARMTSLFKIDQSCIRKRFKSSAQLRLNLHYYIPTRDEDG